jgi:hypothetical protein
MADRNWKGYNEELVKRGEFYIKPMFLAEWNSEIKQMNAGKVGQPYLYPKSMIEFLAVLHCKSFDYRALEGIMAALSKMNYNFPVIDYSQICRRVNKLEVSFETSEENLIVAVDGSGEKVGNRGDWIRHKWKVKRGWIKVVIMGAKNKKGKKSIVDIRIGNEELDERKSARGMIRKNQTKIDKAILDGLHDVRKTFNLCEDFKISTAIKIRKGANTKARGSPRRKEEVCIYKSMPHEEWVREKGYGERWPLSEGIFSADKRIFGETVSAKKKRNMYHEVKLKFWAYNQLLNLQD